MKWTIKHDQHPDSDIQIEADHLVFLEGQMILVGKEGEVIAWINPRDTRAVIREDENMEPRA